MIRNIEFRYDKGVYPDQDKEINYKSNINMRLSDFAYELNDENVIIEYWIDKDGSNRITFKNISPQLHKKIIEELSRFDL